MIKTVGELIKVLSGHHPDTPLYITPITGGNNSVTALDNQYSIQCVLGIGVNLRGERTKELEHENRHGRVCIVIEDAAKSQNNSKLRGPMVLGASGIDDLPEPVVHVADPERKKQADRIYEQLPSRMHRSTGPDKSEYPMHPLDVRFDLTDELNWQTIDKADKSQKIIPGIQQRPGGRVNVADALYAQWDGKSWVLVYRSNNPNNPEKLITRNYRRQPTHFRPYTPEAGN